MTFLMPLMGCKLGMQSWQLGMNALNIALSQAEVALLVQGEAFWAKAYIDHCKSHLAAQGWGCFRCGCRLGAKALAAHPDHQLGTAVEWEV